MIEPRPACSSSLGTTIAQASGTFKQYHHARLASWSLVNLFERAQIEHGSPRLGLLVRYVLAGNGKPLKQCLRKFRSGLDAGRARQQPEVVGVERCKARRLPVQDVLFTANRSRERAVAGSPVLRQPVAVQVQRPMLRHQGEEASTSRGVDDVVVAVHRLVAGGQTKQRGRLLAMRHDGIVVETTIRHIAKMN
jgi:hypothetical protein